MSNRVIVHVDLDAFFASVEQLDFPSYRGKPVIVGGLPGDRRSVVSTASYEARKFGVHSAMPTAKAYQLCPQGIYVRGRMDRYCQVSRIVMNIFREFSPDVQQMSVDEAFIDITGTELLFGSPETTARKIKERVREVTGLTVSIGLASNKYLAKIASGMNKPDGLYVIPQGSEERFMLSLPLDKLWGVGAKTRKNLNDKGFYTVEDIHQASVSGLVQLFGESTGMFLYQAVRGNDAAGFNAEPKSRSISNETTYTFDLTDREVILTALLNLCYTVYFRLLSEGLASKTVHLKIRYEDFSTVSIQETLPRYISSTDDLYERIVDLLDKKWDRTLGIRLLGVGVQNIEEGAEGEQKELFDFGESKKRAVETAVLELQKKDPHNLVKKARQFLSAVLLFFSLIPGRSAFHSVQAADISGNSISGSPTSLFSYGKDDAEVEFLSDGSWESSLSSNAYLTFTKGQRPQFSGDPFIYSQKTDISLWFMLMQNWYFEATLADDFSENTVAAGYYGDSVIRHIRIGNRGITFPQHDSLYSLGMTSAGSSVQAPGIMISLGDNSWSLDAMLRFDQFESFSQTWYGKNSVTNTFYSIGNWTEGRFFYLPEDVSVNSVRSVWIEDAQGERYDAEGRKYRQLPASSYLISPSSNSVILSEYGIDEKYPAILFEMQDSACQLLKAAWPAFTADITQAFESFPITDFYDSEEPPITALKPTRAAATTASPAEATFLYVKIPGAFSPFEDASHYTITPLQNDTRTTVQYRQTGTVDTAYGISEDFFNRNQIQIQKSDSTPGEAESLQRFPFAGSEPKAYVTGHTTTYAENSFDRSILIQTVVETEQYDIGLQALGETVTVRINDRPVAARYEPSSGYVFFDTTPGPFDTVTITWKELAENGTNPILHSAIGLTVPLTENLSIDTAASAIWPWLTEKKFSSTDNVQDGSVMLASQIRWNKTTGDTQTSLTSSTGILFSVPDITGTYRIEGFDVSTHSPLLFSKSPFSESIEDGVSVSTDKVNQSTVPAAEKDRSGYEATISWNNKKQLTQGVHFSNGDQYLPQARFLTFWIKGSPVTASVYLTAGGNRGLKIPLGPYLTNNWQKIQITLTEKDRLILSESTEFVLTVHSDSTESCSGFISLCGDSFGLQGIGTALTAENTAVSTAEVALPPVSMVQYTPWLSPSDTVQSLHVSGTTLLSSTETTLSSSARISPVMLSSYNELSYLLLLPESATIAPDVTIEFLTDTGQTVFSHTVSSSQLEMYRGSWFQVQIPLSVSEKKLLAQYPVTKRILTATVPADKSTANDIIDIWYDECTAQGISSDLYLKNNSAVYFFDESLLGLRNTTITASLDSSVLLKDTPVPGSTGTLSLATTIPAIQLEGTVRSRFSDKKAVLQQVSYTASTDPQSEAGRFVSGVSHYQFTVADHSTLRDDSLTVTIPVSPLLTSSQPPACASLTSVTQHWQQKLHGSIDTKTGTDTVFSTLLAADFSQQTESSKGTSWLNTIQQEFSFGTASASTQTETITAMAEISIAPWHIAPSVSVTASEKNARKTGRSATSIATKYQIPISIGMNQLVLAYDESTQVQFSNGTPVLNYFKGFQTIGFSMPVLIPAQVSFPFAGTENAIKKIQQKLAQQMLYGTSEMVSFSWNRPVSFTKADIFIPSSFEITTGSVYSVTPLDSARQFHFLGTLSYTSFNWLSSENIQDENRTSLSVGYSETLWQFSCLFSETLLFTKSEVTSVLSGSLNQKRMYSIQETILYTHWSTAVDGLQKFTHKEQCDFHIARDNYTIQLRHTTDIRITRTIQLSGAVQGSWNHAANTDTLGFGTTVSGTLQF